jgi:hypothetical protein
MDRHNPSVLILPLVALALATPTQAQSGDEPDSFLSTHERFIQIEDSNQEAEVWTTCAAIFDFSADAFLSGGNPAAAEQIRQYRDEARIAVSMSLLIGEASSGMDSKRLDAYWHYAQVTSETLPKARRAVINGEYSAASSAGEAALEAFWEKFGFTTLTCKANREDQQAVYIDTWNSMTAGER